MSADVEVFLDEPQMDGTPRQMILYEFYRQHSDYKDAEIDFKVAKRAVHFAEYILDNLPRFQEFLAAAEKQESGGS
jgi:hypothetical protein